MSKFVSESHGAEAKSLYISSANSSFLGRKIWLFWVAAVTDMFIVIVSMYLLYNCGDARADGVCQYAMYLYCSVPSHMS